MFKAEERTELIVVSDLSQRNVKTEQYEEHEIHPRECKQKAQNWGKESVDGAVTGIVLQILVKTARQIWKHQLQ